MVSKLRVMLEALFQQQHRKSPQPNEKYSSGKRNITLCHGFAKIFSENNGSLPAHDSRGKEYKATTVNEESIFALDLLIFSIILLD
ncbi:MAG: hypothetical protein ACREOO_12200 [bacterium]